MGTTEQPPLPQQTQTTHKGTVPWARGAAGPAAPQAAAHSLPCPSVGPAGEPAGDCERRWGWGPEQRGVTQAPAEAPRGQSVAPSKVEGYACCSQDACGGSSLPVRQAWEGLGAPCLAALAAGRALPSTMRLA